MRGAIKRCKLGKIDIYSTVPENDAIKETVRCGYVKSTDLAARFAEKAPKGEVTVVFAPGKGLLTAPPP